MQKRIFTTRNYHKTQFLKMADLCLPDQLEVLVQDGRLLFRKLYSGVYGEPQRRAELILATLKSFMLKRLKRIFNKKKVVCRLYIRFHSISFQKIIYLQFLSLGYR